MIADIVYKLRESGIVSILRGFKPEEMMLITESLLEGGVKAVEVTMNTPHALESITTLKESFGDDMIIGAGTVLDSETARAAILAGADFILSPTLNLDVIKMCNRYAKVAIPGVMTPTEALTAIEYGAQVVKIFPVQFMGPGCIRAFKGPLDQVEVLPVGGISLENAGDYIQQGAFALGVGLDLVNEERVSSGNYNDIIRDATAFTDIIKECERNVTNYVNL